MFAVHRRSGRDGALLLLGPEVVVVGGNDKLEKILVALPQPWESVRVGGERDERTGAYEALKRVRHCREVGEHDVVVLHDVRRDDVVRVRRKTRLRQFEDVRVRPASPVVGYGVVGILGRRRADGEGGRRPSGHNRCFGCH